MGTTLVVSPQLLFCLVTRGTRQRVRAEREREREQRGSGRLDLPSWSSVRTRGSMICFPAAGLVTAAGRGRTGGRFR